MFSLEDIMEEISKQTGTSRDEISRMVEEKQDELSGLVSPEGAAYIVGKELGASLLKEAKRDLKIKNITSGIRSADISGRIIQIFETRNFEKGERKGSVSNIIIGDDTGTIRFSLWNDEIEIISELGLQENDIVQITGGFIKEDNRGNLELRLGKIGKIEKMDVERPDIPKAGSIKRDFETLKAKSICDFTEGERVETRACIAQVFRRNPFFEVCPVCEARMELKDNQWMCKEHGNQDPKYNMVISAVIDDGTGNIKTVFFREAAESVLGAETDKMIKAFSRNPMILYDNIEITGKEFLMGGRVKISDFTGSQEFVVNEVREVDVKKECETLLEKMKA
jgi:ssDNA-binding replication factor A large subunit